MQANTQNIIDHDTLKPRNTNNTGHMSGNFIPVILKLQSRTGFVIAGVLKWYTGQSQKLVSRNAREGSTPSPGTKTPPSPVLLTTADDLSHTIFSDRQKPLNSQIPSYGLGDYFSGPSGDVFHRTSDQGTSTVRSSGPYSHCYLPVTLWLKNLPPTPNTFWKSFSSWFLSSAWQWLLSSGVVSNSSHHSAKAYSFLFPSTE
jgi:hypothetical protein